MHSEELTYLFKKNPNLLRVIKLTAGESNDHKIRHIHYILNTQRDDIKALKLIYNQFTSFSDLYKAFLIIATDKKISVFDFITPNDLSNQLNDDGIDYFLGEKNSIIAKITNYQELKKYGTDKWCIYRSEKDFNSYTKNKQRDQYIIFNYNTINKKYENIGFTYSKKYFIAFDHNNVEINKQKILKFIPESNDLNLKIKKSVSANNDFKISFISMFVASTLVSFFSSLYLYTYDYYTSNQILHHVIGTFGFGYLIRGTIDFIKVIIARDDNISSTPLKLMSFGAALIIFEIFYIAINYQTA